jgi:hypothetical protein
MLFCREEFELPVKKLGFLGAMFLAVVSILGGSLTEADGWKRTSQIFRFVRGHAVFIVVVKLWGKRFLRGLRIVIFGDYVFLSIMRVVLEITYKSF